MDFVPLLKISNTINDFFSLTFFSCGCLSNAALLRFSTVFLILSPFFFTIILFHKLSEPLHLICRTKTTMSRYIRFGLHTRRLR